MWGQNSVSNYIGHRDGGNEGNLIKMSSDHKRERLEIIQNLWDQLAVGKNAKVFAVTLL